MLVAWGMYGLCGGGQDPTGKINGYMHEGVVNEYGPDLSVGCVLLLSRVSRQGNI